MSVGEEKNLDLREFEEKVEEKRDFKEIERKEDVLREVGVCGTRPKSGRVRKTRPLKGFSTRVVSVSYTHLTLPTTPYV